MRVGTYRRVLPGGLVIASARPEHAAQLEHLQTVVFPTLADEERAGASIVLYYGFSVLVAFDALGRALERFKETRDANAVSGYRERVREFEEFMGYSEFAERARRYGVENPLAGIKRRGT